jgi:hypothetical protein
MKPKIIRENHVKNYKLHPGYINIIQFSEGRLVFPEPDKMVQLQLYFTKEGKFELDAGNNKLKLGTYEDHIIEHQPGIGGMETQPSFIFLPNENRWLILTIGIINFPNL